LALANRNVCASLDRGYVLRCTHKVSQDLGAVSELSSHLQSLKKKTPQYVWNYFQIGASLQLHAHHATCLRMLLQMWSSFSSAKTVAYGVCCTSSTTANSSFDIRSKSFKCFLVCLLNLSFHLRNSNCIFFCTSSRFELWQTWLTLWWLANLALISIDVNQIVTIHRKRYIGYFERAVASNDYFEGAMTSQTQ
jgi:hypothetical protein